MSIIPKLLAGEAVDPTNLSAVRHLLGGGKKTNRQVGRFAQSAKKSSIGGDAGFDEMTAAQQREFIGSSETYAAKRIKRHKDVTGYTRAERVPEAPPSAPEPTITPVNRPITHEAAEMSPGTTSSTSMTPNEPNILQRAVRFFGGDTTGRAAANAGETFEEGYKRVFSSDETAAAFGLSNPAALKEAFGKSGDDFTTPLQNAGLTTDQIAGLQKFQDEITRVSNEGGNLSEEGMQAMLKNTGEVGNMYAGFSRAGATASPNALLRGMAGEGTGMESVMGIAAVAGLAGGANVMMGGEFTEGAAVGGIGAMSVRGIAKGVAGSMGDIEGAMMKSILGDDMVTAGTKVRAKAGTKLGDLSESQMGDLTMGEISPAFTNKNQTVMDFLTDPTMPRGAASTRQGLELQADITNEVTGGQARRQNLQAIQRMGDDDERLQGFGKKMVRDRLNPNKEKNVAMNNRALVLGGGMLSGVAFTGNADKRDYRRGFNAHRGNRI